MHFIYFVLKTNLNLGVGCLPMVQNASELFGNYNILTDSDIIIHDGILKKLYPVSRLG